MSAYFLISLYKNHKFYFSKVKPSSLISSNSGFYMQKPVKRNSDTYKLTAKKNLSLLYSKVSIRIKVSLLAMWHHIYTKINKIAEQYWKILAIMKDSLFIDNSLLLNFVGKAIDIINYLYNRLLTRHNSVTVIFKKTWTNTRQNLEYIQIFKS